MSCTGASPPPDKTELERKQNKNQNNANKDVETNNINNDPAQLMIPLMRIPISIYSVNFQALVDTGAAASFISLQLLT